MVKIERVGGESPRRVDIGGVIMETGCFRTHYSATVEQGDNFDEVARQLGARPQELYQQNRELLGNDSDAIQLQEGQVLRYNPPGRRGLTITI